MQSEPTDNMSLISPKILKLAIHQRDTCHKPCSYGIHHRSERKELTAEMKCDAGPPDNERQCHNNLISVPNRNARGINEQLIPENCLYTEQWPNTYVRRTTNSEAAIDPRHKNN